MRNRLVFFLPVLAGIMFGGAGVFVRILIAAGFNNPTVLFLRVSFAFVCMLVFLLAYNRKLMKIDLRDLPLFIGTGVLGMMGLNLCYNEALSMLTLSLSAVLLCTAPVFVVIIAAIFLNEKITRRKLLCMALAIVGCIFASGLPEQSAGMQVSVKGVLFGIGSAVFLACHSTISRKALLKGYHTYTIIFYSVLLASVVLLPFAQFSQIKNYIVTGGAGSIVFLFIHSLWTSVLPYIFMTLAIERAGAGIVSIISSGVEPSSAVVFGMIFYAEYPTPLMIAGIAVTIIALVLLTVRPDKAG